MQLNLASAVGLLAAITPALAGTFVVPKFEEITKLVIETRDILKDFNLDNAAKTYPSAVARLTLAGSHKNSLLERFPTSFDTADQASLCETYVKFVTASQDLYVVFTEKGPALASTIYKQSAEGVLRQDERSNDGLTFKVIDLASSCSKKTDDAREKMEKAFSDALDLYI